MSEDSGWQQFERQVAEVLVLAGYHVEKDVLLGGGQTDVVAFRAFGPLTTRLLIECKYSDGHHNVGVDAVENFVSRVIVLRTDDLIDAGILVTNTGFTKTARLVTSRSYVQLVTLDQLSLQIFDFQPYLSSLADGFDVSRLSSVYVRPKVRKYEPFQPALELATSPTASSGIDTTWDLIELCDRWLGRKDSQRLCVLGDYGTGKTSFCQFYAAHCARLSLKDPLSNPIPLLIPLNRFTKAVDVDAMVTDFMVNQCQLSNFRLQAFQYLLERGRFVLLLDGFDEMSRYVDRELRYTTIVDISKLGRGSSKLLVTGRPSYFPTDEELVEALGGSDQSDLYIAARNAFNELLEYELIELLPFSDVQIRSYIGKNADNKDQARRVLSFIQSRYDLMDLASRPVLLDMIMKSLPKLLEIPQPDTITVAKLYDVYTSLWIDREHKKGAFRKLISKDEKLRFMEELAFQLFSEGKSSLTYRQLGEPITAFFDVTDSDLDYFSHDIRTCSFLHRVHGQGYTFVHRSFAEFFVAKKLLRDLRLGIESSWSGRHLPGEVSRILGQLVEADWDTQSGKLIEWAERGGNVSSILAKNSLWIALIANWSPTAAIQDHYGMLADELQGYATFRIGDSSGSRPFESWLTKIILRLAPHGIDDTGDIIGDVFFRASKQLQQQPLMSAGEIQSYLHAIVRHSANDIQRRLSLSRTMELSFDELVMVSIEDIASTDDVEQTVVTREHVREVLATLAPVDRRIIELLYLEGWNNDEIANELGISPNSLRIRIARMRHRIRERLVDY